MMTHHHNAMVAVLRLLFSAACAHAATVTPAAAAHYYFSTPLRPAHLHGEVMGSPPAYYIPRSEDFDWLREATMEREALSSLAAYDFGTNAVLRPEFGKWALSETNRFCRWATAVDAAGVTNVVIGYNPVTNSPSSSGNPGPKFFESGHYTWDASSHFFNPTPSKFGFLDPDVGLITNARVTASNSFTNIYTVASQTLAVTASVSTINIPMTNGTVSVHSNVWAATIYTNVQMSVTNVVELDGLDYCHVGDGAFPGFTNAPPLDPWTRSVPVALSNAYFSLRGATRLADNGLYPTNGLPADRYSRYNDGAYVSTNDVSPSVGYEGFYQINGWHDRRLRYDAGVDHYVWVWIPGSSEWHTFPARHDVTLPTRFHSDVVTTGGVQRVTVEAAFAVATLYYSLKYANAETDYYATITNVHEHVVVPVAAPEFLDTSNTTRAYLRLTVDSRSILDAAAAAAGVPSPPQSVSGFTTAEGYKEEWIANWNRFIIFYRLHPTSKFADW